MHIRYEDGTALPGTTISAGLCLQSLVAETTNSKWKETQINGKAKTIFKLLRFTKFSLYWNADDRHSVGEQGATNWRLSMRDILESTCQVEKKKLLCKQPRKLWPGLPSSRLQYTCTDGLPAEYCESFSPRPGSIFSLSLTLLTFHTGCLKLFWRQHVWTTAGFSINPLQN